MTKTDKTESFSSNFHKPIPDKIDALHKMYYLAQCYLWFLWFVNKLIHLPSSIQSLSKTTDTFHTNLSHFSRDNRGIFSSSAELLCQTLCAVFIRNWMIPKSMRQIGEIITSYRLYFVRMSLRRITRPHCHFSRFPTQSYFFVVFS